jgi:hypothetical protein
MPLQSQTFSFLPCFMITLVVSLKFIEQPVLIWESAVAASNSVTSHKAHRCVEPDSSLHIASDNILGHYIDMFNSN